MQGAQVVVVGLAPALVSVRERDRLGAGEGRRPLGERRVEPRAAGDPGTRLRVAIGPTAGERGAMAGCWRGRVHELASAEMRATEMLAAHCVDDGQVLVQERSVEGLELGVQPEAAIEWEGATRLASGRKRELGTRAIVVVLTVGDDEAQAIEAAGEVEIGRA